MKLPWRARDGGPGAPRSGGDGEETGRCARILFPYLPVALSRHALDAALRLARAEHATLLPVFLAAVPRHLELDAPLPRQAAMAVATQEAVERRAAAYGVDVDARVERGRTPRHALDRAIRCERYDRIVIAAAASGAPGFVPDDVAWLLGHAAGEIVVMRPRREDPLLHVPGDDRAAPAPSVAPVAALG